MKKIRRIVLGLLLLTVATNIYAQAPVTTLSPASFTANDQVTITADVTGTPMAGATTALIWIWCYPTVASQAADQNAVTAPDVDAGGNWGALSSNPGPAMMTNAGGNVWKFTFSAGTNLFGLTPGNMYSFNYLIRSVDGNTQTKNAITGGGYKFVPLIFVPSELRIFPAQVDTSDVVALNFDQSQATATNDQRMTPDSVTITAFDDQSTAAQIGTPLTVAATSTAAATWTGYFIPSANFPTIVNGHKLAKFTYHFSGTILDVNGNPSRVSTAESVSFTFTPMH